MLDKKDRSIRFPDNSMNFSSAGPDAPHLQNPDFRPSSYFIDMNILEEKLKNRKFMNLDGKNHPGVSSVLSGNNQYYNKDNFSVGRQAEFENINNVLFSNPRQPYSQQKESSYFHETFKEDFSSLRDTDHIGCARQAEQSGFRSEYSCDLLRSLFHTQDRQQRGMIVPTLPVVLEPSRYEGACLEQEKLKNNAYTSKESVNIYLGKQDESTTKHSNIPPEDRSSSLNSERLTEIGDEFSANVDEQNKPASGRVSPVTSEKIWDGLLKLNTSTTVSAVSFFKSGEKVQDLNWPAHVEIKGKVRLQAFEKFIQELPRSRNRALMVISLCWKVGSCRSGLAGMMEVAKGYRQTEKVGFAQIHPGIDLYLCPRSDIIITILAKYGFFKGMAAIEEDQDSLIGCVVWRRSQSSTNNVSKDTVGKKTPIEEQPLDSTELTIPGMNSPTEEARECEKKQVMSSETEAKAALDLPGSKSGTAIAKTVSTRSMITENKSALSSNNSQHAITSHCSAVQTLTSSIPYSCPLVPAQQKTSERPLNFLQENVKPADVIPLAQNSGTDEAVLVSDSTTQFALLSKIAPVFMLGNSLSSSVSQSLGNFDSGPAPGIRPLIPVVSSNFQFQPQLALKTPSSSESDSNCAEKNLASSFQAKQPALPGPPPLPLEPLQRLIQSNENVPKAIITGGMLQDKIHIRHHIVTRGPTNALEARPPSLPQIQKACDGSNTNGKEEDEEEEDDDLPEFDFDSACAEPEAPVSRFPGFSQQIHFPNAPPLNEKSYFESPWSPDDHTPIEETSTKSFEALQHRPKLSPLPSKLFDSNERLSLAKNFGTFITERTPSNEGYQLTKDLGNNPRHGFGSERRSLWDDDDDDMPEWCPPDLDLPLQPLPSATNSARLLSGRPIPTPDTAAPSSFHHSQSHELLQSSQSGLLGTCPPFDSPAGGPVQIRPLGESVQFRKPPLGSRQREPFRPHAGKFNRRHAPYATDGKRHRR